MNRQNRASVRAKDRARKTQKDQTDDIDFSLTLPSTPGPSRLTSPILPDSPAQYAKAVSELIDSATPSKNLALEKTSIITDKKNREASNLIVGGVKAMYEVTKSASRRSGVIRGVLDSKVVKKLKERGLVRAAARMLRVRRNSLIYSRRSRQISSRIPEETAKAVRRFYMLPKISSERPEVRFRGKRLMCMSVLQAYKLFKAEFKGVKVTHKSFLRLRPKNVIIFKKYHFNCKCTYCCNIEMLCRSLNGFVSKCSKVPEMEKAKMKKLTVYDVEKTRMREKRAGCKFYKHKCITKECLACSGSSSKIKLCYKSILS